MTENVRSDQRGQPGRTGGRPTGAGERTDPAADPATVRRDRWKLISTLAISALAIGALIWRAGA